MTKSTITDERITSVIERMEHFASNLKWTDVRGAQDLLTAADGLRELQERRKAAMDGEPVVPEEIPGSIYEVIYQECGGFVDCDANAQTIWNACRAAMLQAEPVTTANKLGNSPVIPDGYVMVPKVLTEEMIAAAMNCEDVIFNSDDSFCVQFGNIYDAMLAAAPQEVKP
ncbi:hypothetical protein ACSQOK_001887 [Klebsiella aerogenes]